MRIDICMLRGLSPFCKDWCLAERTGKHRWEQPGRDLREGPILTPSPEGTKLEVTKIESSHHAKGQKRELDRRCTYVKATSICGSEPYASVPHLAVGAPPIHLCQPAASSDGPSKAAPHNGLRSSLLVPVHRETQSSLECFCYFF